MKKMLSGLNLGGNVQMFNPGMGGGMGGLEGLFSGGGGGNHMNKPAQSDDQMRIMARAMASAGAGSAHDIS